MPYRQVIAEAYNAGVEEEHKRLTGNPLREAEYQLIIDLLDEYLPNGSVVIDIGSGPGRYAEHLLKRACKVGLVDLSANSLKAFSDRIENTPFKSNIIFNQVSCAAHLEWVPSNSADAILLMGPLYHLIDKDHQAIALAHCHRILKCGGYLFTVFLSRFSPSKSGPMDLQKHNIPSKPPITHTWFKGYQVPQFRCCPSEAKNILSGSHFKTLRIRNIEGTASRMPDAHWEGAWTEQEKKALLNSLIETCEMPDLLGQTQQFICVAKRQ